MLMEGKVTFRTTEMHTGGDPVRIVESGYPEIPGETLLEKNKYVRKHFDHYRKILMLEPRGHHEMYGAVLVRPDAPDAHMGALFIHNDGYATMCGHAVISLARYAVERGLVETITHPETSVNIQCPCGLVRAYTHIDSGRVRFHSVPAFAFALDIEVDVKGHGRVVVDVGYGGAFYAFVSAEKLGLDLNSSPLRHLVDAATAVSDAVNSQIEIEHPLNTDLGILCGTMIIDGQEEYCEKPARHLCIFADRQVARSPSGSSVTARIALQYARKQIRIGQIRRFQSSCTGSEFTGMPVKEVECGPFRGVIVEVAGNGYFTGSCTFTREMSDPFADGFLIHS